MNEIVLKVKDLKKHFSVLRGLVFMKQVGLIKAVDGVGFTIGKGETFGLVGESGCGKTTIAKLILLIEEITSGTIRFDGQNIEFLSGPELKKYRNSVKAVFQDPYSSLNPRMRVGSILAVPIVVNNTLPRQEIKDRIAALLELVELSSDATELYPHEFSGGQRQRIAEARALALNPKLIILDEPVSALDVSIRPQIMNLVQDFQERLGLTYLLIAHDLAVVKYMSNKVGVMYLGRLVEIAESKELYQNPCIHTLGLCFLRSYPHIPKPIKRKLS